MTRDLAGRVAIVTGASRGIGFAAAEALGQAGADLLLVARRPDVLEEAHDRLAASTGSRVIVLSGDVADPATAGRVVGVAQRTFGRVDILVNNAGGPPAKPFLETTAEDWQAALAQNLLSALRFAQAVAPGMQERRWGRVINVASTVAREPVAGMVLSSAARAALVAAAKTMAIELAPFGITVNTVFPGPTETDRAEQLIAERAQREEVSAEDVRAGIAATVPLGRMASPEEIAAAVAFLASETAGYITGTVLAVDGGLTRSLF